MDTLGWIVLGGFLLVFVAVPVALIAADGLCETVEKWWARHERRIKRELISRWLTELDMTAVPAQQQPYPELDGYRPTRMSAEELLDIINRA